jgi:hypothetical protein
MDGESSEDDGAEYADDGTGAIARPAKRAKTDEKPKKVFLNNKAALEDKLADIRLRSDYPWVETLELVTAKSFAETTDHAADAVHDDLKREAALSATHNTHTNNATSHAIRHHRSIKRPLRAVAHAASAFLFGWSFSFCSFVCSKSLPATNCL